MDLIRFGALTERQRRELEGSEDDPFDAAGHTLRFRPKDQHVALRGDDGHLVASTGLVLAEVQVGAERFDVVGLGGVIVNSAHRGRGLARQVVEAALSHARTLGPRFALLFCHQDRAGLYRKLAFTPVTGDVRVAQPGGFAAMPQLTMWRALRPDAVWPEGGVTLHSLPF